MHPNNSFSFLYTAEQKQQAQLAALPPPTVMANDPAQIYEFNPKQEDMGNDDNLHGWL